MVKNAIRVEIVRHYGTQELFAQASGIAEPTVSKIVRGIRPPTEDQRKIFKELLGVEIPETAFQPHNR
jgi:transcriptional regulator with XRE-family HTH domain